MKDPEANWTSSASWQRKARVSGRNTVAPVARLGIQRPFCGASPLKRAKEHCAEGRPCGIRVAGKAQPWPIPIPRFSSTPYSQHPAARRCSPNPCAPKCMPISAEFFANWAPCPSSLAARPITCIFCVSSRRLFGVGLFAHGEDEFIAMGKKAMASSVRMARWIRSIQRQ